MVKNLIQAVARALVNVFGDGYEIYVGTVEQGMCPPCFRISHQKTERTPLLGRRYLEKNTLLVEYFPGNKQVSDLCQVGADIVDGLEFITGQNGDVFHGTDRSWTVLENNLCATVRYSTVLIRTVDTFPMEEMTIHL